MNFNKEVEKVRITLISRLYRRVMMMPNLRRARMLYCRGYDAVFLATEAFIRDGRDFPELVDEDGIIVDSRKLVEFLEEGASSILPTLEDANDREYQRRGICDAAVDVMFLLNFGPPWMRIRDWGSEKVSLEDFRWAFNNWRIIQGTERKLRIRARKYALYGRFLSSLWQVFY